MKKLLLLILYILTFSNSFSQTNKYQEIVDRYNSENNFNGAVLVAIDGKIDYIGSIGLANQKGNIKFLPQEKFRIASMTKVFTAILVMKLYEEGKIQLNATIGTYFPTYKGAGKDKVTIHHLLTYSSGIENQAEALLMESYQEKKTLDTYIDQYCSGKLITTPGEKSSYSNTEYIILQKIIENVSHKSYAAFLQETILKPLKLKNTGIINSDVYNPYLGESYTYNPQFKTFITDTPYRIDNFFGAGNMYSTVQDMLVLNNALFKPTLLSEKTTSKMLEINQNLGYTAYGLWGSTGWGNFKEKFYYRTGGILGATSNWIHTMDSNKTIIVMSNTDATNLYDLSEKLYLASLEKK